MHDCKSNLKVKGSKGLKYIQFYMLLVEKKHSLKKNHIEKDKPSFSTCCLLVFLVCT